MTKTLVIIDCHLKLIPSCCKGTDHFSRFDARKCAEAVDREIFDLMGGPV